MNDKFKLNKRNYFIILFIVIATLSILLNGIIDDLNNKFNDNLFSLRGPISVNEDIIIVSIDDISFLDVKKRWPWPRTLIATAINNIEHEHPQVIALDINLSDTGYNQEEDLLLSQALIDSKNIVLGGKFSKRSIKGFKQTFFESPLNIFSENNSVGFFDLISDSDGFIRNIPISVDFNDKTYYSFSREVLNSLKVQPIKKSNLLINFSGSTNTIKSIPIYKVINDDFKKGTFKNKIVLIGSMFPESHDNFPTPHYLSDKKIEMYGIEIHANAINTVLNGLEITSLSWKYSIPIIFILLILTTLIFIKIKPVTGGILLMLSSLFILVISYLLFKFYNIQFEPVTLILTMISTYIGGIFYHYKIEYKDKARIRNYFSKYVSPSVVDKILKDDSDVMLGGKLEHVTIFFSDIRGFTPLTESLDPGSVVEMLNEYFSEMADIIFKYDGTLNKFIGDAIMAIYGAPIKQEDSEIRAVMSGLDMRDKLVELNYKRLSQGKKAIRIGMGIHSGSVVIGNIGSKKQMEFTAIGDPVNACSRIESLTKEHNTDFLISEIVYNKVKDFVEVETLEPVFVKGKSESLIVHKVIGRK